MKQTDSTTENLLRTLPEPLLGWYRENARDLPWRRTTDPYQIWVSEIMLQQTRVAAVLGYYARFLETFPTVEALAAAPEERLMKLWEGLGYYSRARNLQRAARQIMEEHGGIFPSTYEEIRALSGVGDYTAGAISSIAFGIPVPAVDGNVLRVMTRLTDCHDDISDPKTKRAVRAALAEVMPEEPADIRIFNQAMMEQFHIRWLVTKDGGAAGGFDEKAAAASAAGAQLVVIRRPPEQGETASEVLKRCKEMIR